MSESLSSPSLDGDTLELSLDTALKSRAFLIQRLSEIVCWPATRIPPHERELAADVLVGLLRTASIDMRERCAARLAVIVEAPKPLLRYLARDAITVARPLLEHSPALDDSDLLATIRGGVRAHWLAIAGRRHVTELVAEALVRTCDPAVVVAVLRNKGARLSVQALESAVLQSRDNPQIPALLSQRPETSPAQALTMFWWAEAETRLQILRRFAVDRAVLCGELADLFALAAHEDWADAETRKAIALIERRQRNRAAAEKSPFGSLENAIAAGAAGIDRPLVSEISYLAGIRPQTGAKIMSDKGGEGIAILCKATGLKRDSLRALWRGLRRPEGDPDNPASPLGRVMAVFDLIATLKAQTVLRYWNWSLTSAINPAEAALMDASDEEMEFSPARRSAALVFGRR
ncbi:MAG: DUF2336 domain-containing protein [Hyphomonadaceae bacterium]|nr:DUF2336 domain-containing protein [Hyphomonadaceae bacterium]